MLRIFHILFVTAQFKPGYTGRLLPDPPLNWKVEQITLQDVLGRLQGLAGVDALVINLNEGGDEDWTQLIHFAIDDFEGVPVIALIEKDRSLPLLQDEWIQTLLQESKGGLKLVELQMIFSKKTDLRDVISGCLHAAGRVDNRDAVLVTHGTDTMAWAFAYLRYALSDLRVNVAMTGSQLPLEGTFSLSDALGNLRTSVYLLNRLIPGKLFLVFNEGRHVYSGSLNKIRKWDQNAFDGRLAGAVGAEWVDFFDQEWGSIAYADQRLERLHLFRTGGTIESTSGSQGSLTPGRDYVGKYLNESLSSQFDTLIDHTELNITRDSSNISMEDWERLACSIAGAIGCDCDTHFDRTVKVVYANPFMTAEDYSEQFAACQMGVVLAGYGAGNANTLETSHRSVLPAIRQAVGAGKTVVLSSQVPLEAYDMDYQVGRELVQAGGLPAGDLSLADAQIKLSYLCGHRIGIEAAAQRAGLSTRQVLTAAFLTGVKLRKKTSRTWLIETLASQGCSVRILKEDSFEVKAFETGLQCVIDGLRGSKH